MKATKRMFDSIKRKTTKSFALLAIVFVGMLGAVSVLAPATAQARVAGQAVTLPGSDVDAEFKTKSVFQSLQGWAGWVLIAALVIAAMFAIAGQYKYAIGIAIGCIVLYGGVYILSMVRSAIVTG